MHVKGGCAYSMIAKILVAVGGLNWGLVGLGMLTNSAESWNVVNMLLGDWPVVEAIVYLLVGISAVVLLVGCRCKKCVAACATCMPEGSQKMGGM